MKQKMLATIPIIDKILPTLTFVEIWPYIAMKFFALESPNIPKIKPKMPEKAQLNIPNTRTFVGLIASCCCSG